MSHPGTADTLEPSGPPVLAAAVTPAFAHASEAELARILDFYDVRWQYEPHAFPIRWSLEGEVLESFSPDFYLPELDLYLELTTLKQRLVRKKNRKLRRLRELYPDIRVKLFYARDFRALMLKYGKLAIADALSGTDGQLGIPAPVDGTADPAIGTVDPAGPATPTPITEEPASHPPGSHRARSKDPSPRTASEAIPT